MRSWNGASRSILALLILSPVALLARCGDTPSETSPPAHVENPPVESELSQITLTPEAVERLGIETQEIELRDVASTKVYGGDVTAPPGQALTITPPLAGVVLGAPPLTGAAVVKGRELFRFLPLSPDSDPIRQSAEAAARLEQARAELQRAEQLLKDRAASERRYEDAKAALAVAEATHQSVSAQLENLKASGLEPAAEGEGFTVSSPINGRIARVHVTAGQRVAVGEPLFEVFSEDPLWIRVPVYTGDLAAIDREGRAFMQPLRTDPSATGIQLEPVETPPIGDPVTVTVDLHYVLPNPERRFQPGQKVTVSVPLHDSESGLVVPYGAILYDIDGGTWVYEASSPQVFVRRRVELARVAQDLAVLRRGPQAGTSVVTVGAAELFGTEFGVGH
jgi:RND family efflux transporter MFP subunit